MQLPRAGHTTTARWTGGGGCTARGASGGCLRSLPFVIVRMAQLLVPWCTQWPVCVLCFDAAPAASPCSKPVRRRLLSDPGSAEVCKESQHRPGACAADLTS
jgi:hypothetical protein